MTYSSIGELPTQVQNSLSDADQKIWMEKYNSSDPQTKDEIKKAKRDAWYACRNLPSSFSFKATASADITDKDKERVDLDSIMKHIDDFIDAGGNIQYEHANYTVACCWGYEPITKNGIQAIDIWGNLFGGDDGVYDNMRKSFVKGVNSFSIGAEGTLGRYQCDNKGCFVKRDVKQLMEISICKVPANSMCTLSWYNDSAKLTKSGSDDNINLSIDEYTIHKDYHFCPIQSLKKSLIEIGYDDVHATKDGVLVKMSFPEFERDYPLMKSNGLTASWSLSGYATLNETDYLIEKSFKDGYSEGYIDENGKILPTISECSFKKMADLDLLTEDNGEFYLVRPNAKVI